MLGWAFHRDDEKVLAQILCLSEAKRVNVARAVLPLKYEPEEIKQDTQHSQMMAS